uniref:PTM/DIR17-like Tudor domain-containing protein n=1 Tax=Amphora coffeiformis TaxID=265554 RepID=A0A7S3LDQ4_9STRA
MATEQSETHPFQAKDGLFYETYLQVREANVQVNNIRLAELGLNKPPPWKKPSPNSHPRQSKKARKSTVKTEPPRRSTRQVPVISDASVDNDVISKPPPKKKQKKVQTKKVKDDWESVAAEIRREHAKNVDNTWFQQFERYWKSRLSDGAYKQILRQVRKLYNAEGISYIQWPADVCFHKDQSVDMSTDFEALHQLAHEYERKYGRDLGNGWLLRIPIRKLCAFQRYYFEKELGASLQPQPAFPIGTMLHKSFPPHGTFVGRIKSFDGVLYRIHYPEDGDEEDIYEDELFTLLGVSPPDHSSPDTETQQSAESSKQNEEANTVEPLKPRYTVGTTFAKVFPGHGTFMGQIESFDGVHYHVVYPRDGDQEDLTEAELDELKILSKG